VLTGELFSACLRPLASTETRDRCPIRRGQFLASHPTGGTTLIHEDEVKALDEKVTKRRAFLKSAGFTGLGLAAAGLTAGKLGAFDNSPVGKALGIKTPTVKADEDLDIPILNFALNLEYLEAEFYCISALGQRLSYFVPDLTGSGAFGETTGGSKVDFTVPYNTAFTAQITEITKELAYHEIAHVVLLRDALGNSVVAKPAINLAALGIGFASLAEFLTLARAFEDTGMSAYNGAAPLITSKAYLAVAAEIALTEANHSGLLRYLCALRSVFVSKVDDLDILPPPAGTSYANVTSPHALAVSRTTSQVLSIVYGNSTAGTASGGFYPNGMNGVITTV